MIYLDNAATTFPKPDEVYEFANNFYRQNGVYQGRGNYNASLKVSNLINETRQKILNLFCAPINYTTVFTHSATLALNTILNGLDITNEINIYISHFEHNSVFRTLNHIHNKKRIKIIKLCADNQKIVYNINNIKEQFDQKPPNIVILNHGGNVFGNIAPVVEIFNLAKLYGATTILDCSQTSGLIELNLKTVKSDFTVFAGHKTLYSPFGIAGFVMNNSKSLNPSLFGGTGTNSADIEMPKTYPQRLECGSMDIYAIAGLSASLDWIHKIGINNIFLKEQKLYQYTIEELSVLPNVNVFQPVGKNIGIISFIVKGYSPDEVAFVLNKNNIAVRAGLHCAPEAHKFIGTFPCGTVRIGLSYFNCKNDIDILINIINKFLS